MEPTIGNNWNPRHSLKDFDPRRWQSELTFLKTYVNQAVGNAAPRIFLLNGLMRRARGLSRVEIELAKFSVIGLIRAVNTMYHEVLPELQQILDRLNEDPGVDASPQTQEDPR